MAIRVKRAYEKYAKTDGPRILADRLWPRGLSKAGAHITYWAKEATPSAGLRRWYHADPERRFKEFEKKYRAELRGDKANSKELFKPYGRTFTLVTAVKDIEHSHIPTLVAFLAKR